MAASLVGQASVALMTKGSLGFGSTLYAQGGVAAAIAADDRPELHFTDTMVAGAGLSEETAVRILVEEAPGREWRSWKPLGFDSISRA